MRGSSAIGRPIWTALTKTESTQRLLTSSQRCSPFISQPFSTSSSCRSLSSISQSFQTQSTTKWVQQATQSKLQTSSAWSKILRDAGRRHFQTTSIIRQRIEGKVETTTLEKSATPEVHHDAHHNPVDQHHEQEHDHALDEFGRSAKATKAAQINLRAKLKKDPGAATGLGGFSEVWRLIKIAKPQAKWLGVAFVFLLISSAISMSIPFSIGKILDTATSTTPGTLFGLSMVQFYFALGGVLCLGAVSNYGRIIILRIVGERIVSRLRASLFRRTYTQDAEFFDANRVGDLISRLSSDTVIVGKSVTQNLSDGLRALVTGAAGLGMMTYTSLYLTGIMSLMIPPIGIGAFFYGRQIRHLSRQIQKALGSATKVAEERLSNVRTSQAFAGERIEVGRYNKEVRSIFNLGVKEALLSATFFSTTGLAGNMTILAILVFGSQQVASGAITLGQLSSFLMYTAYTGSSLFGLSSFYSELMKGVGAASRLFELQDSQPTLSATKGEPVRTAKGVITFEDVVFAYPTRPAVTIFEGLSFSIPPGTNVAVVGSSGGGKSTISSLLLRFYSPTSGRILIDDHDIATMNIKSLRRRIGIVSQDPVLFSGTIADNISYGKPHATRSEIISAAKRANCDFISDFPDGLDTSVGARGLMLSGGQRQRIAIARALVKDPDVLILDEATSALDAESETLVNEALNKLMQGAATTISIAHRLSTIKRSEHIIVLGNNGRVAEHGTFEELSNKPNGAFRKLMESQLGSRRELAMDAAVVKQESLLNAGPNITLKEADAAELAEKEVEEEEEDSEGKAKEVEIDVVKEGAQEASLRRP